MKKTAKEILANFENYALTHEEILSAMEEYAEQWKSHYDELIERLKLLSDIASKFIQHKGKHEFLDYINLQMQIEKSRQLLKQAEQKFIKPLHGNVHGYIAGVERQKTL